MCGIIGIVSAMPVEMTSPKIQSLINIIKHRGPDSQNHYLKDNVFLGHSRLSIIDLSENAAQPMSDSTGRAIITYNGEIYNYAALRSELEQMGVRFKTHTDTEVLIEAYIVWGEKMLEMLDGMFAFCIYDRSLNRLFLARDRFGKKPLYYKIGRDKFLFASEADAVDRLCDIPSALSPSALNCYFAIGYILEPQSIYEGIYKLQAGHYAIVEISGFSMRTEKYWDPLHAFIRKTTSSFLESSEHFSRLFDTAVKKRLIGDVPAGALLSGGIDSSGVVAYMAKYCRPQTFSAVFENELFTEKKYSDLVAEKFGTMHHECHIRVSRDTINDAIGHTDQILADNSIVAMHQLCRQVSKYVKVVLSGDGADEIMGGYNTYTADIWKNFAGHIPASLRAVSKYFGKRYLTSTRTKIDAGYQVQKFFSSFDLSPIDAHYFWRQHFSIEERVKLMGNTYRDLIIETDPVHTFRRYYDQCRGLDLIDAMQYIDIMTWLKDDILVKSDICGMAYGLEIRCPYLDLSLFEFAASLPASFRVNMFQKKILLKHVFRKTLPRQIINRKKAGFNVPIADVTGRSDRNEYQEFNLLAYTTKYKNHDQYSHPRL